MRSASQTKTATKKKVILSQCRIAKPAQQLSGEASSQGQMKS